MNEERLRQEFWRALLATLEKCQRTIDLLERLDAGSNRYLGEWEELDSAFAHMHNVRRWVGRSWIMGQDTAAMEIPKSSDTALIRRGRQKRRIDRRDALRGEGSGVVEEGDSEQSSNRPVDRY